MTSQPKAVYSLSTIRSTTFFSKLRAFLANKEVERRPVIVRRKLDGAVDEFLVNQKFVNQNVTEHNP